MKKPLKHIFDYLILSFLMSVAVLLTLIFNGNRLYQTIIIISTSLLYVFWGLFHHQKEGSLHPQVIWEYFLYALLGSVLVLELL